MSTSSGTDALRDDYQIQLVQLRRKPQAQPFHVHPTKTVAGPIPTVYGLPYETSQSILQHNGASSMLGHGLPA
jgi:hypothetical protein